MYDSNFCFLITGDSTSRRDGLEAGWRSHESGRNVLSWGNMGDFIGQRSLLLYWWMGWTVFERQVNTKKNSVK